VILTRRSAGRESFIQKSCLVSYPYTAHECMHRSVRCKLSTSLGDRDRRKRQNCRRRSPSTGPPRASNPTKQFQTKIHPGNRNDDGRDQTAPRDIDSTGQSVRSVRAQTDEQLHNACRLDGRGHTNDRCLHAARCLLDRRRDARLRAWSARRGEAVLRGNVPLVGVDVMRPLRVVLFGVLSASRHRQPKCGYHGQSNWNGETRLHRSFSFDLGLGQGSVLTPVPTAICRPVSVHQVL
jgi:hypothetical protein